MATNEAAVEMDSEHFSPYRSDGKLVRHPDLS